MEQMKDGLSYVPIAFSLFSVVFLHPTLGNGILGHQDDTRMIPGCKESAVGVLLPITHLSAYLFTSYARATCDFSFLFRKGTS